MAKQPQPSDKEEETVTVSKSQLEALLARVEKLEAEKAEDIEITADLPQAQGLQPGQYVNVGAPNQAPDLRKVRWTKAAIEKAYQPVTFVPLINVTVAPHGIPYGLRRNQQVTVPSIVRDLHDTEFHHQEHQFDRYRTESPMEVLEGIQRSKENPGVPIWGRLHITGHGLDLGPEQQQAAVPPTPAETKA